MPEPASTWSDAERPGRPSPASPDESPLARLHVGATVGGRYQVLSTLGQGGMGVVLRAHDPQLGREVAIKLLREPEPRQAERLRREALVAASLRHPGIVALHELGDHEGHPFLVYELVQDGRTLEDLLERAPQEQLLAWVIDAARALGYAHERGVVHRDVKPDNLLIDGQGRLRVADFGLASAPELERLTRSGQRLGTPRYMAPEQARGDRSSMGPGTDVWALGVILYRVLCRQQPFPAANLADLTALIVHREPRPPREVDPQVPPALSAVCVRALRKQPARRQANGAQLADELEGALRGEAPPAPRGLGGPLAAGLALAVAIVGAALLGRRLAAAPVGPESAPPAVTVPAPAPPPGPPVGPGPDPDAALPPAPVARLAHGPSAAIGVRFLDDMRLLTWSTLPPWLGADPSQPPDAQPMIRVWKRTRDQWTQEREWTLAGVVEQLAPLPTSAGREAVLLLLSDPRLGWSLLRFDLQGDMSGIAPIKNRSGATPRVTALAVSPDGRWVALATERPRGSSGKVEVFELDPTTSRAATLQRSGTDVYRLVFLPHGDGLMAASQLTGERGGSEVTIWSPELWTEHRREGDPGSVTGIHHDTPLRALEIDPDRQGWVGRSDGTVWHMEGLPTDRAWGGCLPGPVLALRFPPGQILALSSGAAPVQSQLQLIDRASGRILGALRDWQRPLASLDVSPDGRWVAVGLCSSDRVEVFPLEALRGLRARDQLGPQR